jgi:DNA-binding Lrp family transcriptional regulator
MLDNMSIDSLDSRLIALFASDRVGVLDAARRLGVARGTVQARLDKLRARGVVRSFGADIDPAALGYEVAAFVTLDIRQAGGHDHVGAQLALIPEVLEAYTITGAGDMLLRVVARSNVDLQRVLDRVTATDGVERASTAIALQTQVAYRVLPLVATAAATEPPATSSTERASSSEGQAIHRRVRSTARRPSTM